MPVEARIGAVRVEAGAGATTFTFPARPVDGPARPNRIRATWDDAGRLRVGLVLPIVDRTVDVSVQPGLVERFVAEAGETHGGGRGIAVGVARRLVADGTAHGAWAPADPDRVGLVGVVGGSSFPLLGRAYDAGAAPVREVPRWAAPILAATDLRAAARAAFGPRATRPVVRALGEALTPDRPGDPVALGALALGVLGAAVAEPDALAALVRAARGDGDAPSGPDLERGRRTLLTWGPEIGAALLADAAGNPARTARLWSAFGLWASLGRRAAVPPARRVDDLHEQLLGHLPLDPWRGRPPPVYRPGVPARPPEPPARPAPRTARPQPAPPEPAPPPEPRVAGVPVAPRLAPETGAECTPTTPVPVDPVLGPLDGRVVGELRLVLPRTVGEVAAWGERLGNCLGDYGPAVVSGRSRLVGVERGSRLRYCVELAPDGTIRQFLGARNRPPRADDAGVVRDVLAAALAGAAPDPALG